MKIRNNAVLYLLYLGISLVGCSSNEITDALNTPTVVQILQLSPSSSLEPTPALTQTVQRAPNFNPTVVEPIATLPQPSLSVLQYQPLEIMPALPTGANVPGRLVVNSDQTTYSI